VPPGGEVEVDTFGLLPDHIGQGIGGHFLTVGVRLAWAVAPAVLRVWLHTSSSRDHRHAPCQPEQPLGDCNRIGRHDENGLKIICAVMIVLMSA
jgi:hypothetical protein